MTTQSKSPANTSSPAGPDWFGQVFGLASQQKLQSVLWRESMETAAALVRLRAEWLTGLAAVNNPMDAVALNSQHCQNVLKTIIDENTRLAKAVAPALVTKS